MTDQREGPAVRPLSFAVAAMDGAWLVPTHPDATFAGAAADSRRVRPHELFFALPGERVDGFDFCGLAAAAGATAVVVAAARGIPPSLAGGGGADAAEAPPPVAVIGVRDPLTALADLARAVRGEFQGRVVGVTGSNGKTTTKELCAAALSGAADGAELDEGGSGGLAPGSPAPGEAQAGDTATGFSSVLRTEGSYNTEIGLPLTILSASGRESFWVLEMAMRGRGQIALLADIAKPHVGVITNVAGAHLELLGSLEEVARAKGELFAALDRAAGVAVLPGGDALIEAQAAHLPESRKIRFDGGDPGPKDILIIETTSAGVAGQIVRFAVRGQPVVSRLPLAGVHNARNAAAALAVAAALQVSAPAAARALARTRLPPHRSFPRQAGGRIILDDCYNANPASMRAALRSVIALAAPSGGGVTSAAARTGSRAFAILGDMLEIGPDAVDLHRAIGREAGQRLAGLATVGELGAELARGAREAGLAADRIVTAPSPAMAAAAVAAWTRPGDWILVKASRGMRLERAVDALVENFSSASR